MAGGRKLLQACRELEEAGANYFAVVAPQNQPLVGQLVDADELRDAAQSRVDVTLSVLAEFGIEAEGAVMDRNVALALDDATRATKPDYVLLSALYETRFGLTRKDLVEWAKVDLDARVEHIPVTGRRRRRALGPRPHARRRPPRPSTALTCSRT